MCACQGRAWATRVTATQSGASPFASAGAGGAVAAGGARSLLQLPGCSPQHCLCCFFCILCFWESMNAEKKPGLAPICLPSWRFEQRGSPVAPQNLCNRSCGTSWSLSSRAGAVVAPRPESGCAAERGPPLSARRD